MAASGDKDSDSGQAEDFKHRCGQCLTIDQLVEAHVYCLECQQYLCKNCFSYHERTKASKDKKFLDKAKIGKPSFKQSDEYTEKCDEHKTELIKYFCPEHEVLGCYDCKTQHHSSCDIDYILDRCTDIGDSDEYRQVLRDLGQRVKEANGIMNIGTDRLKEIDYCYDSLIKEVVHFRKEINDRLDELQSKIQADADRKKSVDKEIVQNVLQTCGRISSEITCFQSILEDMKNANQYEQLYINIKKAKMELKTNEVEKAGNILEGTNMHYKFECSQDMVSMAKADILGQLNLYIRLPIPGKEQSFQNLTLKEALNVKTKSDKKGCDITGCAFLSANVLVLADNFNNKVKVVDIEKNIAIEEKSLDSSPLDIAVLPQDQIAVTIPARSEVVIMTTAGNLSAVRKIPLHGTCRGICYNHSRLYVVCKDPSNVYILDTLGNIQNTISLKDKIFNDPFYILYNENSGLIYLSTGEKGSTSVVTITLQGNISALYKHKALKAPEGMLMLNDGSLLVCGFNSPGTIHHISKDLKQNQKKYRATVQHPNCICLSRNQDEIYIGCWTDHVKVFSLK